MVQSGLKRNMILSLFMCSFVPAIIVVLIAAEVKTSYLDFLSGSSNGKFLGTVPFGTLGAEMLLLITMFLSLGGMFFFFTFGVNPVWLSESLRFQYWRLQPALSWHRSCLERQARRRMQMGLIIGQRKKSMLHH
jgi:uncharacterized membrane protein YdjX (TVP38/TMEM64 family)